MIKEYCSLGLVVHEEEHCECFPYRSILQQWKHCSAPRGLLGSFLVVFSVLIACGQVGPPTWNWVRVTLAAASLVALFIVSTVPEHFLEEHLWKHVAKEHVPRIFVWTFGALLLVELALARQDLGEVIRSSKWGMLVIAGLVGVIPESGPHLAFVTFYSKKLVPFSVLLTSSIVQDGHGMLPVLAHSWRVFLLIKLINLIFGMIVGNALMAAGM